MDTVFPPSIEMCGTENFLISVLKCMHFARLNDIAILLQLMSDGKAAEA